MGAGSPSLLLLLLLLLLLNLLATADDLVMDVSSALCVRLFHNTGSVGCRSSAIDGVTLPLLPLYDSDFPRLSILSQLPTSTPRAS